jgi:two-component system, NtrC family, nitrogen regulation sensor histidine kinase NtrY
MALMTLSTRTTLAIAATVIFAIGATLFASLFVDGVPAFAMAALLAVPAVILCARFVVRPMRLLHDDLGNAFRAARDGDYGLRLVVRGEREAADLRRLYNELADAVRENRQSLHDKEIVLDTILQRTPTAVVLLDSSERVLYSNTAAREVLANGARLDGRTFSDVSASVTPALRDALDSHADVLFNVEDETFQLTQRLFRIHTRQHRLLLVERLTPELRRQEVAVWKQAIRVINHEINNTVAPISSLFHSARRAHEMPEHRHRLEEIYALIDERLAFLRNFLEAYAEFARLPAPRKQATAWSEIFEAVRMLYPFRLDGPAALECNVDRMQMQQALINLVKNAHESGSDPAEVAVALQRSTSDWILRVLDRGRGMSEDVMRRALVPFYSTRSGGSGVGLALSNEIIEAHGGHLRLQSREGGGTEVTAWIPH